MPVLICAAAACTSDFDTTRTIPPRGTVGQELFIVLCDRVAAQALPEDVTGVAWHPVCHPDASGNFAATVDQSKLVAFDPGRRERRDGTGASADRVRHPARRGRNDERPATPRR